MAEQFFTYDMMSMGYAPSDIIEALMYSRSKILYTMNQELFQKNEIDTAEISEDITTVIEERTLNDNFEETKKIIDEEMYRSFFVIKSTPEF